MKVLLVKGRKSVTTSAKVLCFILILHEIELECVCYCQIKFNGNFAESYIVVIMAGRWIMYENGAWDFKIDNDRMGRTVDCSKIKGVDGLKESIYAEYCLLEGKFRLKCPIVLMMERVTWFV